MLLTLAFRHLLVRPLRSLFLLVGFSLGVGVMIVLLSVGEAMLEQSRDVSLVGGGEITVLPQGIDIEAMRTGGVSGMFFGIDRARFLTRQALGGPRWERQVRSVAPAIENKLLYLTARERTVPVRAGGMVPSRAAAVGAALDVRGGRWEDSRADSAWVSPSPQQLYDELDRFHLPPRPDSTWGEWHYFNVAAGPEEWWYVTFLVGGAVRLPPGSADRWGGQLLVTHRRPDGGYDRYTAQVPATAVNLDTLGADLTLGENTVRQHAGAYTLSARGDGPAGTLRLNLEVRPAPNRYFPPVELREEALLSGYVVPGLVATAKGTICAAGRCRRLDGVRAYHDHNWGVWRDVTWEWGAASGPRLAFLYGGVYDSTARASPFFLALTDSLGVRQVLRFGRIEYQGRQRSEGVAAVAAPRVFRMLATRDADTVRLHVTVDHALASAMGTAGFHRFFLQMRGRFTVTGTVAGSSVADSGAGFFETYVSR